MRVRSQSTSAALIRCTTKPPMASYWTPRSKSSRGAPKQNGEQQPMQSPESPQRSRKRKTPPQHVQNLEPSKRLAHSRTPSFYEIARDVLSDVAPRRVTYTYQPLENNTEIRL